MEVSNDERWGHSELEDAQARALGLPQQRHRLGSCSRDLPNDQILCINYHFEVAILN